MNKPPLGVVPKAIWDELRIRELSRAIHEHTQIGNYEPIKEWVEELQELLQRKVI
jgi:hypothetical protein